MCNIYLLAQPQQAVDWGNLMMWVIYLAATGGLIAAAYFLLPKRLRQRRLWFKLPIGVVALQLLLVSLSAIDSEQTLGLTRAWFIVMNFPMLYVMDLPIFENFSTASHGFWPGGAMWWSLMLLFWVPMPFMTGLILERRRRREKGMHGHS